MSADTGAIRIRILDKEYLVSCKDGEEDVLQASANYLNDRMSAIRASGKVVGVDRIAVMAGLNIAHEAIEAGVLGDEQAKTVGARLQKLNDRIEAALAEYRQPGLN